MGELCGTSYTYSLKGDKWFVNVCVPPPPCTSFFQKFFRGERWKRDKNVPSIIPSPISRPMAGPPAPHSEPGWKHNHMDRFYYGVWVQSYYHQSTRTADSWSERGSKGRGKWCNSSSSKWLRWSLNWCKKGKHLGKLVELPLPARPPARDSHFHADWHVAKSYGKATVTLLHSSSHT